MNKLFMPLIILGMNFQALCEPVAEPGPSPVADAGRKKASAVQPVITRQPSDEIVTRGRTVTLNCGAEGYPFPQISWLKNGTPFRPDGNHFMMPSGIMFYNMRTRDEGVYLCLAKNTAGTARSRNATLRIAYIKEDFRTIPEDVVAAVGGTAELRCEGPRGAPEPTISWKKGGRSLSADSRRIRIERGGALIITGARKSDSGSYQCVASNVAGDRTSVSVLLSVHEPPVFTVKPVDQTVVAGDVLELACEARGDPKPRIRWTKPSSVQPSRAVSLTNGNLRIANVQEADGGRYKCTAENMAAEISTTVDVVVNSKPHFTLLPQDTTARVGDKVSISCKAEGKPVPPILWHLKDGTNMFPRQAYKKGRFEVQSNGDMTVYNVQFADQGEYTCEAYNSIGSISATAQLTVISLQSNISPPVIRRGPSNATVAPGGEIELKCSSSSVPAPDLKWTKDGSGDVTSDDRFVVTTSGSLKISKLQSSDAGRYTCTATNDFGWSKWDTWLKVSAKEAHISDLDDEDLPAAPGAPSFVNATSTSITLRWTPPRTSPITGYIVEYYCPQSKVSTWNRVGALVPATVYTVRGLEPSTSCVFFARAQNRNGNGEPSEVSESYKTLDLVSLSSAAEKELQDKISQISVRVTRAHPLTTTRSSAGIRLVWESSAYCGFLDGFKITLQAVSMQKAEPISATAGCYASNFELENLQARVVYEIRIQPYNGSVVGHPSPIVLASTESESGPPDPPTLKVDTKIGDGEDFATGVFTWTAPPGILPEYITRYSLRCSDASKTSDSYDVTKYVSGDVTTLTLSDLPRGRDYNAFVYYNTLLGEGVRSRTEEFSVIAVSDEGASGLFGNPGVLAGIAGCVVALLLAIVVGIVIYRRHKRGKKNRGLHGRPGIPLGSFSGTQYTKSFTMSVTNPGGGNNYSDGTGSSSGNPSGNPYLPGLTAPAAMGRNTTVALNNGNGNVGTSLSGGMQPTARHASSFSYVNDQLTNMSNIQTHYVAQEEGTPTQALSAADLHLLLQRQQQYQRQVSENQTVLYVDLNSRDNLIDMDTPTDEARYAARDQDLPPPPPSPPMSQKTSLSDRTNRSRGSSRNSAERGSNHSRGRRSRERVRAYPPQERVPTDTDTGIDSPQQTPSPPRPSDMRAEHHSGIPAHSRVRSAYPYEAVQDDSRRRNKAQYGRDARPGAGYLGGPSECDTESEVDTRRGRANYMPHPDDVRNSVAVSSVSMMNRYDSESACSSRSRSSSVESLNMESASQVGADVPRLVTSPGAFDERQPRYDGGLNPQRVGFAKPKPPKKHYIRADRQTNGHYADPQPRNAFRAAPDHCLNTVNSSSSCGSSYRQNTADSGMSAGVGSFGGNSMNSSSSVESGGAKGPMSRSRTIGSISAENQISECRDNAPVAHFASADRRHLPDSEYQHPQSRSLVPQPRCAPKPSAGRNGPQRKFCQDSNFSLPSDDKTAYIDYDVDGSHDRQPMLPISGIEENDVTPTDEGRTSFLTAKALFAGVGALKQARGGYPELTNVPEVSTSDFCEDYSDRSH